MLKEGKLQNCICLPWLWPEWFVIKLKFWNTDDGESLRVIKRNCVPKSYKLRGWNFDSNSFFFNFAPSRFGLCFQFSCMQSQKAIDPSQPPKEVWDYLRWALQHLPKPYFLMRLHPSKDMHVQSIGHQPLSTKRPSVNCTTLFPQEIQRKLIFGPKKYFANYAPPGRQGGAYSSMHLLRGLYSIVLVLESCHLARFV